MSRQLLPQCTSSQLILSGALAFLVVQIYLTSTGAPPTDAHTMDHHNHDGAHSTHSTDGMMMMYFHGGYQETLWFRPWHTASASQFLASLVLLACICIIHEAITALRVRFHAHLAAGSLRLPGMVFPSSSSPPPSLLSETTAQRAALLESHGSTMHVGDASPAPKGPLLMNSRDPATAIVARLGTGTPLRAVVCVLYGFNVLLSYMLMLAVMTFNTWYMAVLVVGLAVGHFVCYPLRADSEQASADGCCVR